jgi:hypothetical protein
VKILSLTAGAASMYCGSFARQCAGGRADPAGHDVTLLPFIRRLSDERRRRHR